jgi:hypothetical protein
VLSQVLLLATAPNALTPIPPFVRSQITANDGTPWQAKCRRLAYEAWQLANTIFVAGQSLQTRRVTCLMTVLTSVPLGVLAGLRITTTGVPLATW